MNGDAARWALRQPLPPSPRLVLWALACAADTSGRCAEPVKQIAKVCCIGERAARDALKVLERDKIIAKDAKNGTVSAYRLLGHFTKPRRIPPRFVAMAAGKSAADSTALNGVNRGGFSTAADSAPLDSHAPAGEVPSTPIHESSGTGGSRARVQRATRLPDDWQPTPAEAAYAIERGLDPAETAENFRGYFLAKPGAAGTSLNWTLNWQGWCRRQVKWDAERAARGRPAAGAKSRREMQHERIMAMVNGEGEARH